MERIPFDALLGYLCDVRLSPCSPSVFPSLVDFSCDTQAFSHCDLQPIASLCRCIDSPADLSKIESIRFGDTTFLHTPLFYLANLEKLRVVTFGPRSFFNVVTMHFASRFQCPLATRPPFSGDDQLSAEQRLHGQNHHFYQ